MPTVHWPYTKKGEQNAKAAAKEYGGKYVSDKKDKGGGASIMIAVGSPVKKKKKSPARRTSKKV
jgi:hypothetical protein